MTHKSARQHPLRIFSYMNKYFWLLSIPLVRGLYLLKFDFATWARGAWLDIAVILLILTFAIIRWLQVSVIFNGDSITVRKGFIYHADMTVFYRDITSVRIEKKFFFRPIKASGIHVDTNSGSRIKPDVLLLLKRQSVEDFLVDLKNFNKLAEVSYVYKPKRWQLVFFSFIFSNTLSGVILVSTLINQGGNILGKEIESKFLNQFNSMAQRITSAIPPAGVALASLILFGWLLSFSMNLLRYWRFSVKRCGDNIVVNNGFATERMYFLTTSKINYTDFRQNLFTLIFKIFSVHVHCTGYGKEKRSVAVLIPITTQYQATKTLDNLLMNFPHPRRIIKPDWTQLRRFVGFPLVYCFIVPVLAYIFISLFNGWMSLIIFASIIFEIPFVWLLIVKAVSTFTTSIGLEEEVLTLKYSDRYSFHTVMLHVDKICMYEIRQTIFQRNSNNCDLFIYNNAEHTKFHRIRCLPYNETVEFLSNIK